MNSQSKSTVEQSNVEISPDVILTELNCILRSSDFQASTRLKNFLEFVVQEVLEGRAHNTKAYNIAIEVFGRDEKFDPVLDPIVRVEAGKLRRRLERYYFLNQDNPLVISLLPGSYVPVFTCKGFEKVTISHVSEPPPEQEESHQKNDPTSVSFDADNANPVSFDADNANPVSFDAGSSISFTPSIERRPKLVIMPFTSIGNDNSLGFFVDGLNEDILAEMSKSSVVDVVEVAAIGAHESDILGAIYRAKGIVARFVLCGSVQLADGVLRTFASLTDAKSAQRIWTERFDLPFNDACLLELQDEITYRLVAWLTYEYGLINRTLLDKSRHKDLEDIDLYEASLRHNIWSGTFDKNDWINAKQALEKCIELDPDNSMVCAFLSDLYSADYEFGYDLLEDNLDRARNMAKKALALNPTSQLAHWILVFNYLVCHDTVSMTETLNRIVPTKSTNPYLNSTPNLFVSFGVLTGDIKDIAKGSEMVKEAFRINPYTPNCWHMVPFVYHYINNNYEDALSEALLLNMPTCIWDPIIRAIAYIKLDMKQEANKAIAQLLHLESDFKNKQDRLLYCMLANDKLVGLFREDLVLAGL